jgi:hypothetical protein
METIVPGRLPGCHGQLAVRASHRPDNLGQGIQKDINFYSAPNVNVAGIPVPDRHSRVAE